MKSSSDWLWRQYSPRSPQIHVLSPHQKLQGLRFPGGWESFPTLWWFKTRAFWQSGEVEMGGNFGCFLPCPIVKLWMFSWSLVWFEKLSFQKKKMGWTPWTTNLNWKNAPRNRGMLSHWRVLCSHVFTSRWGHNHPRRLRDCQNLLIGNNPFAVFSHYALASWNMNFS